MPYDRYGEWYDENESYGPPDQQIPPQPPPEVMAEPRSTAMGYGTRAIIDKGNTGNWITPSGGAASPGDIRDIQDTVAAVDAGVMTEPMLREKIRGQIPGRPTDQQMDLLEQFNDFYPHYKEFAKVPDPKKMRSDAESRASSALYGAIYNNQYFLLSPVTKANWDSQIKKAGDDAEKQALNLEHQARSDAFRLFEKKMAMEGAKEKPPQATEWGLRERAATGDLTAIAALKQAEGEKTAEDKLKREISDKDLYKPLINNLPKTKDEAVQANTRVAKYEQLHSMAEKGAGGLIPGLKAFLSPVGEAMGMDVTEMSEAQVYQLMARAAVGSQRLMLVGSGQVSNYEQDLMQRLSGGSIKTSREAAKELFKFYIKESKGLVDAYNTQIDNISEKFPDVKKMYGYVGKSGGSEIPSKPKFIIKKVR